MPERKSVLLLASLARGEQKKLGQTGQPPLVCERKECPFDYSIFFFPHSRKNFVEK